MLYTATSHCSIPPAAHNGRVLGAAQLRCQQKQVARLARAPAALPGATLALVFGFLPWTGCSQGGFYDTGVQGVHGSNCQAMYQPAAAAEARFAASLQGGSSGSTPKSSSSSPGVATAQEPDPGQRASATAAADTQQQGVSTSQRLHEAVPDAAKELVRGILREDNRARTKQLVDDAWQTLE